MVIEEVPRAFRYTCDRCGRQHMQGNAAGHYWESTPPDWSSARFIHNNGDHNTNVRHRLWCRDCTDATLPIVFEVVK